MRRRGAFLTTIVVFATLAANAAATAAAEVAASRTTTAAAPPAPPAGSGRSRRGCNCHGCLSLSRNNYLSAFGEAMETLCNRDSLGSVGLVCRNSTVEAANRH